MCKHTKCYYVFLYYDCILWEFCDSLLNYLLFAIGVEIYSYIIFITLCSTINYIFIDASDCLID